MIKNVIIIILTICVSINAQNQLSLKQNLTVLSCPDPKPVMFTLFGPHTISPGEVIGDRLMGIVENIGSDTTGLLSVGIYFSQDSIITTSDDLLLYGREFLGSIPSGGASLISFYDSLLIPGDYPLGTTYLGIIIDDINTIAECDENNNALFITLTISTQASSKLLVPTVYPTIMAAIAAAFPYDTIEISAGEYDEEIIIDKDLVIIGAGQENTILKNSLTDIHIMSISNAEVEIQNLQFRGWYTQPDWLSRAIDVEFSNLSVTNCLFFEIGNYCIYSQESILDIDNIEMEVTIGISDVGIQFWDSECKIGNSRGGNKIDHVFDARGYSRGVIENNIIDGSAIYWGQGIRVMDSSVIFIRNNVIIGQHDENTVISETGPIPSAIAYDGHWLDFSYVEIYNNIMQGFIYGLYAGSRSTGKVYNNIISNNVIYGIKTGLLDNETIIDLGGGGFASVGNNLIENNGDGNFWNQNAGSVSAKHNYWGSYDSTVIDNTIYDNEEDVTVGEVYFMPYGYYTNTGSNVMLDLGNGISITFNSIVEAGVTSADTSNSGPEPPENFLLVPSSPPLYFNINSSADYSGSIEICIAYNESDISGNESLLQLNKYFNGEWVDITSSLDILNNIICGISYSLSMFVFVEPILCCNLSGDANNDDEVGISDLTFFVDYMFIPGSPGPDCFEEFDNNGDCELGISDLTYFVDYMFVPGSIPPVDCHGCK